MRFYLQLAAVLLMLTPMATIGQISLSDLKKEKKPPKENVEWLWQYGPPPSDGRENQLVLDPRFRPFLAQYLTAPQTFWAARRPAINPLPIPRWTSFQSPIRSSPTTTTTSLPPAVSTASVLHADSFGSTSAARILSSYSPPSTGSRTTKR